jgi:hypothetical protein
MEKLCTGASMGKCGKRVNLSEPVEFPTDVKEVLARFGLMPA